MIGNLPPDLPDWEPEEDPRSCLRPIILFAALACWTFVAACWWLADTLFGKAC